MKSKLLLTVLWSLALPTLILSMLGVALAILGFRPYVLQSTSMEPLYTEGSLCIVNAKAKTTDIAPNDAIVYVAGHSLVLHRVVSIDGNTFEMKGDMNENSQHVELDASTYIGRLVWSYPRIGKILEPVIEHYILIIVSIVLLLIALLTISLSTKHTPSRKEGKQYE